MTKPTPEQFGLTTETVTSLTQEMAQRDKRRGNICLWICIAPCVVGAVAFYVLNIKGPISLGLLLGVIFTSVWFAMCGFIVGLLIGIALLKFINYIVPDPMPYSVLKRYLDAVAQYEAWFIRTQQTFWDNLTGRGFEIEVTNLLNRAGYRARLTPASGDGGVDIVLGDGTIVQCKAHRAPASPGVVRELYGTLTHQNAPKALLISRSGVTNGVHSFIQGKPIMVWDTANLIALQKGLDESGAV